MTAALATVLVLMVIAAVCHTAVHWDDQRRRRRNQPVDPGFRTPESPPAPPRGPGSSVPPRR